MSSLIRKGGAPKFKPKAPQGRRPHGATPTPSAPSSRQSLDRRSETPGPPARPSTPPPTAVPPPANIIDPPEHQEVPFVEVTPVSVTEPLEPPEAPPPLETAPPISVTEPLEHHVPPVDAPPVSVTKPLEPQEVYPSEAARGAEEVVVAQETIIADIGDVVGENGIAENSGVQNHVLDTDSHQEVQIFNSDEPPRIRDRVTPTPDFVKRARSIVTKSTPITPNVQDTLPAGNTDLSMLAHGEMDQSAQLIPTARLLTDGSSEILNVPRPRKQTSRPAKRRKVAGSGVELRHTIEIQVNKLLSSRRKGRPKGARDRTKRKTRERTPDDAEEQEIDHVIVKMSDLTKDLLIGRKFSRHGELRQKEIDQRIKAKLSATFPDLALGQPPQTEEPSQAVPREPRPAEISTRPQMRIVDGQIVIDDASLVVDRHAVAATTAEEFEEVEEDEFTRLITSGTYMKRERKIPWTVDDEEKFYMGLRMFGTDFEMISKMFPNRTRKQVKLKFVKEQREVPRKIDKALSGEPIGIDLEEYKSHTGLEYLEVADIEAEQARREEEHNAHEQSIQAEVEETSRQKRAEIQSRAPRAPSGEANEEAATAPHPDAGSGSAKENEPDRSDGVNIGGKASAASKSKKKPATKRKKRNPHSTRGGGEDFEVLGDIDAM